MRIVSIWKPTFIAAHTWVNQNELADMLVTLVCGESPTKGTWVVLRMNEVTLKSLREKESLLTVIS